MVKQNIGKQNVNRREFIAAASAAATLATLAGGTIGEAAGGVMGMSPVRRVGISDAAYNKAWKRAAALQALPRFPVGVTLNFCNLLPPPTGQKQSFAVPSRPSGKDEQTLSSGRDNFSGLELIVM